MAELNSSLYECRVMHHRLSPKKHMFHYDLFMFYVDLDELDALAKKLILFSRNRFNLYSFWDKDHLTLSGKTAKDNVVEYAKQNGTDLTGGKIYLLTYMRTLGYVFNPVSFYFCFDKAGKPACSIAEVGNTFREMKPYFLGKDGMADERTFQKRTTKYFYVSPFMDLDLDFDFWLRAPGRELELHVDDYDREGKRVLATSLTGKKVPLTDAKLVGFTLLFPLITLKVIFLIHWNALLLWLKKIPFYRKAENPSLQRELFHPDAKGNTHT